MPNKECIFAELTGKMCLTKCQQATSISDGSDRPNVILSQIIQMTSNSRAMWLYLRAEVLFFLMDFAAAFALSTIA